MEIKQNIGFNEIYNIESQKVLKKWGWEEILINRREFCGKILHYNNQGSLSSFHFHPEKKEFFKCLKGCFNFKYKNNKGETKETIMYPGDAIYIPNNNPHQLESLKDDSEILEISTYHDDFDVIRIEPGDSQR